jgi:hypothetical protein
VAQTTFANGKGIAHAGSGGMSICFPSVCNTQCGPATVPIPYPNIGKSSDTSDGPSTVKVDGEMPMVKGAKYSKSNGDQAGSIGGIMSGVTADECEFMLYSFDVKFDGKNVCLLGNPLFQNKKNIMG